MSTFSTLTEVDIIARNEKLLADRIRYSQGHAKRNEKPLMKKSACEDESILHDRIAQHCRENGWLAFHGSMAHSTKRTRGEPDFILIAPGSRVFFIEVKKETGKLSPDQRAVIAMAERLGTTIHVVRSYDEFLRIVQQVKAPQEPKDLIP